jgi:hypothetical protein
MASLFVHHLDEQDAVRLLGNMAKGARAAIVVSDLRRTRLGLLFAWVGCRALSRSHVVHVDGARSVRAAYTAEEARHLADRAGLRDARVTTRWPQRWVLEWTRDGATRAADPDGGLA